MRNLLAGHWKFLVSIIVSLLALYLAIRSVDMLTLRAVLTGTDVWFVLMALGSIAVNTGAKAIRWRVLMGQAAQCMSLCQSLQIILIGHTLNTLLPARAGDVSRVFLAGELGIGRSFALGTVAIEKVLDMVMYSMLFVLLLLLMPLPAWLSQPGYLFVIITVSSMSMAVLVIRYRAWIVARTADFARRLPGSWPRRLPVLLERSLASSAVLQNPQSMLQTGVWTALVWTTAVLTNYLVLQALAIQVRAVSALLVLIVLQVGITIPSVPGKIGIFEYLCVVSLALFDVDQPYALSFGILLHGLVFLPTGLAGLFALWRMGWAVRPGV